MKKTLALILMTPLLVAGCTTTEPSTPQGITAPIMDQSVPLAARNACLTEVARVTGGNSSAVISEMVYSEAGSQLKILVGPQKAPWQCTVANNGAGPSVMSLTDEGRL